MCPVEINIQESLTTRDDDQNALMDRFLYEYVKEDNLVTFKSCVQKHSPDKLVTPSGNSLLHVAVSYESDNIAAYLAEEFPSLITSRNDQEDTILHVAAREGRLSNTVKTLVGSNPCLVKLKNRKGNIPLHDAVIRGKKDAVAWLVCKDPGAVYYNNKTTNKSPLYLAVERGHKNGILDDLLNIEASSGTLREGKSPVHAAIEQRNKDILEKIGKAKPELLRFKDKELGNSLHYASSMGYLEGVRFLLQKFRDGANERDKEGNYPIHLACKNDSVGLVKEFMNVFPYPKEFLNTKGQNILHVAAESGQGKVVRHILKQDQKLIEPLLNGIDEDGNTPLHLATQSGQSNAAFALVRDTHVERSIVNNENKTPYDIAEEQSKIAVDQYEKTDEMLAEERKQFASKNNTPADGTQDKAVDPKKQDKKKPSKDYKLLDYYGAMTTLSILYFKARPKKSLQEHFSSSQGKPPRKEETKSRIQNLLVVAVLVAGVTFSGAIQLPQLKNISNSNEHHHGFNITSTVFHNNTAFESPTGSSLLDGYLCLDVWALNTSVVAAIILLWTNLNDVKFAPFVVWFSSLMVGGAIYMMCLAFFFAVSIALGGSDYGVLAIIIIVVGIVFFIAQTLLYIQWILPPSVNQILEGMLSYYVYFLSFLFLFYSWRWLPDKLSELKRGRTSNESSSG